MVAVTVAICLLIHLFQLPVFAGEVVSDKHAPPDVQKLLTPPGERMAIAAPHHPSGRSQGLSPI